jgi:hypothetical protein
MYVKCKLIKIKLDIDVNNDELLKTIWKHKKKQNMLKHVLIIKHISTFFTVIKFIKLS